MRWKYLAARGWEFSNLCGFLTGFYSGFSYVYKARIPPSALCCWSRLPPRSQGNTPSPEGRTGTIQPPGSSLHHSLKTIQNMIISSRLFGFYVTQPEAGPQLSTGSHCRRLGSLAVSGGAWQRPRSQGLAGCLTGFPKPRAEGVAASLLWWSTRWVHRGQLGPWCSAPSMPSSEAETGTKAQCYSRVVRKVFS